MLAIIHFWSHTLAATMFGGLVLWELRRAIRPDGQRLMLAALALTALWAWLAAVEPGGLIALSAETARNLVWISLLNRLPQAEDADRWQRRGVGAVHGALMLLGMLLLMLDGLRSLDPVAADPRAGGLLLAATSLRLTIVAGALVMVHNVYGQAARGNRGGLWLAMAGLAAMWAYDLNLYTFAYLGAGSAAGLDAWRGAAMCLTVPLFALAARRGRVRLKLSRAATFQSLSLLGICGYFAVMAVLASVLRTARSDWSDVLAIGVLAVMTVAAMVLLPSARARGWARVKLSKHLFEHRYDYRTEWLRFTATIGSLDGHQREPDSDPAPLGTRIARAFADILDAPGGLLLVRSGDGPVELAAEWQWPGERVDLADPALAALWCGIEATPTVVELDARRRGDEDEVQRALTLPDEMFNDVAAWLVVPLFHGERLVGMALLAAPALRRTLDWEDFDLLRTAGRQAGSNLAEAHGQRLLMTAQRFEEFNRRFAFILHDIKNLVSQLSLVARNAQRHADNPEFRADMVATLQNSVGKMNDLLQRLSPTAASPALDTEPVMLRGLLSQLIMANRASHDVQLLGDASLVVAADPAALGQAFGHLLRNAVEASPVTRPILVRVDPGRDGEACVAIIDQGEGMDPDFVRLRLFAPFASTKDGGFGVGAFEAKSLIEAMGGRLAVESRPGHGSSFTVHLPLAEPGDQRVRRSA